MIFLRLTQSLYYQPHLGGREIAAVVGVANGGKPLHQAGIKLHPPLELSPRGFRHDGVAIHLCQLHSSVFSDSEILHTL